VKAKWTWGLFAKLRPDGTRNHTCGWYWRHWGIAGGKGIWRVFHIPSGCYLTSFEGSRLEPRRLAKRFCEEVDQLADWSTTIPPDDRPRLSLQMHRTALRLTGGLPALRLFQGDADQSVTPAGRGAP
jgi:hypothetical protein